MKRTIIYTISKNKSIDKGFSINHHRHPDALIISKEELSEGRIKEIVGIEIRSLRCTYTIDFDMERMTGEPEFYSYYINESVETDTFGLGDIVSINGIAGYVEALNDEVVILITQERKRSIFETQEIEIVYLINKEARKTDSDNLLNWKKAKHQSKK